MSRWIELPRYVMVGTVVTGANFAVYAILTELAGVGHKLAYTLMYVTGLILRFTLERTFVFGGRAAARGFHLQLGKFAILVTGIYVAGLGLFQVFEGALAMNHFVALGLVVLSTTGVGFFGSKHAVFRVVGSPLEEK